MGHKGPVLFIILLDVVVVLVKVIIAKLLMLNNFDVAECFSYIGKNLNGPSMLSIHDVLLTASSSFF